MSFERAFPIILKHEGGYVDHPRDPGGATNLGVTIGTLSSWLGRPATKAEVRALTPETVAPIYRRNYWDAVKGDQLPRGVDLVTFDAGVNSGPSRGARWTQAAAGVKQDGKIGPATLNALRIAAPTTIIRGATDARLAFMQSLKIWNTFGKGWGRRVGEVRAMALAWAGEPQSAIVGDARRIDAKASTDNKTATASGAGAAGSGAAVATDIDWVGLATFGAVAVILIAIAVLLASRARARHDAADAMREVADNMEWEI
jgi:lysozyme family protein